MVMDGIYTGIPKKMHRPTADGIVCGLVKDLKPSLNPELHKVSGSATQFSAGVFGAGATPQGDGDGKTGAKGMALAHKSAGHSMPHRSNKRAAALEKHIAAHNM